MRNKQRSYSHKISVRSVLEIIGLIVLLYLIGVLILIPSY